MADDAIKNILVVDDEYGYRMMILQLLDRMGYASAEASDADEALAKINEGHFNLVISDIRMEGKDGLQLAREARTLFPDLEFIIMTGHAADYSFSDIIEAGATDFLSKPFEAEKLKAKIDRIQRERNIRWQLRQANSALVRQSAVNASIAELSKALLRSLSDVEISALVSEYARELTGSPVAFVGFVNRHSGCLVGTTEMPVQGKGGEGEDSEPGFDSPGRLWQKILEYGEPILLNEPSDDPRLPELSPGNMPFRRLVSVSSSVAGAPLTLVALADADRDYTESVLATVDRISHIYGMAIQGSWANEELKQTKEYLENVLENSAEAIGIVDERGRIVLWNKAAARAYGYEFQEMKDRPAFSLYADREELDKMLERLRRDGFVSRYEINMRKKDGTTAPFEVSLSILRDKNQHISGSVAVAMDLSELKRAMAELKRVNERLEKEIVERKRIEAELKIAHEQLEKLLAERTAKLARAGEVLKSSISRIKDITQQ